MKHILIIFSVLFLLSCSKQKTVLICGDHVCVNKTEAKQVKKDVQDGITKLLYVAPESLTKEENVEFLKAPRIRGPVHGRKTHTS